MQMTSACGLSLAKIVLTCLRVTILPGCIEPLVRLSDEGFVAERVPGPEDERAKQKAMRQIKQARKLQKTFLDLSDLKLSTLPVEIGELSELQSLR